MADILIKGMEMPERCGKCRFATAFECEVTKNFITTFNVRQVDCPLFPVPPHGRLIDADAFKKYISVAFEEVAPELSGGYDWLAKRITEDLIKDISEAPTVIPAEEDPK